jgi:hypothetical protein
MKTKIKFIIAVYIILCYSFCIAQTPAQWLAFQQRELKGSTYIFEGKVIQQSKIAENSTCNVFQVTKIYRGSPQINLGNIKVITTILSGAEKFPELHKGYTYIIFGIVTKSNTSQSVVADNSLTLKTNDWISIDNNSAVWGWRHPTNFPTMDSLYSFFKENGLTVQEEVEQK